MSNKDIQIEFLATLLANAGVENADTKSVANSIQHIPNIIQLLTAARSNKQGIKEYAQKIKQGGDINAISLPVASSGSASASASASASGSDKVDALTKLVCKIAEKLNIPADGLDCDKALPDCCPDPADEALKSMTNGDPEMNRFFREMIKRERRQLGVTAFEDDWAAIFPNLCKMSADDVAKIAKQVKEDNDCGMTKEELDKRKQHINDIYKSLKDKDEALFKKIKASKRNKDFDIKTLYEQRAKRLSNPDEQYVKARNNAFVASSLSPRPSTVSTVSVPFGFAAAGQGKKKKGKKSRSRSCSPSRTPSRSCSPPRRRK